MNIVLDEKLQNYMQEKGEQDLVLYTKVGKGCCCSAFLDVKARFPEEKDGDLLERGYEFMKSDLGRIYYHPDKIIFGRHPKLILNQFLGMNIIQAFEIVAVDQNGIRGIPL